MPGRHCTAGKALAESRRSSLSLQKSVDFGTGTWHFCLGVTRVGLSISKGDCFIANDTKLTG